MPRFRVTGADATTGQDRTIELTADGADAARSAARNQGVLAHRIYPSKPTLGDRFESFVQRHEPRDRARPEIVRVQLAGDLNTIGSIGCGVLLGLTMFAILALIAAVLLGTGIV